MKKHMTGGLLAALLAVSIAAGGCGSRESGDMVAAETAAAAAYNYDSMEMAEEAAMDMAPRAEMKMAAAGAAVADGVSEGGLPASQVMPEEISADRKLIRNVSLGYQTDQFDAFTAMLQEETAKLGGYIESSDMSKDAYSSIRHAFFELRIPKEKLDSFLAGLDGEANLLHRSEYTQDVTLEYHDVESRKKALETEYDTLLRLLEQADSMDAILALNQRLSEIRYQLDSYESNLRMYDNQVQYSRVSVSVEEAKILTPAAESSAWDKIRQGFRQNLEDVGETLAGLGIFLLSSIPTLIVLGLFIAAAVFLIRRIVRRIRRKKEQKKEQNKEQKNIQQAGGAEENAPAGRPENGPAD